MPLPFLCKAVYFSFLDDKSMVITSDIKIPRSLIANMEEVQNLSIDTNGVQVSIPIASYDSAYMGTQNCLLLTKDKTDEILVYHITNYKFVGNYMSISASNTPYIINKNEITSDSEYYIIKNQIPKDAISTFIEWGYAHDSICKEDGTLNITATKDSDLYQPCYNGTCEIVTQRTKIVWNVCDNESDSKELDQMIDYWVYAYVEPREYTISNGTTKDIKATIFGEPLSNVDYTRLPYTIMCYPVWSSDYEGELLNDPSVNVGGFNAFRELNNDASFIYSLRISATPPTQGLNYSTNNNTFEFISSSINSVNNYDIVNFTGSEDNFGSLIVLTKLTKEPYSSVGISNTNVLKLGGYPIGTDPLYPNISKPNFINYKTNPYIALHTTRLRITNSVGDSYDYKPIDLGLFSRIKFKMYDPLVIDSTNVFIGVDVNSLSYSRFTNETIEDYNGLFSVSNTNMVYSNDLLQQYLANNKNAYETFKMKQTTRVNNLALQTMFNSMVAVGQQNYGNVLGVGTSFLGHAMNIRADSISFENSMEDMKNARDNIDYVNNNIFMGYCLKGIGYFVEVVTTTDYVKQMIYREFIDKGIKLNKYIKDTDVYKYLSITDNAYDKKSYKFIQASTNLKGNNLHNSKQLLVYRNYLQNGVQLVKTDDIVVSDTPTNQDSVLQNINEEEFN